MNWWYVACLAWGVWGWASAWSLRGDLMRLQDEVDKARRTIKKSEQENARLREALNATAVLAAEGNRHAP